MAVGVLRDGIREELDWLEITEIEHSNLQQLHLGLSFMWGTGLTEGKAVEAVYSYKDLVGDLEKFDTEKFFSRTDLEEIAAGTNPYYDIPGTETDRLAQFLRELIDRKVAPAAIYNYWQSILAEFDGDEFKAVVELAFRRPLETS